MQTLEFEQDIRGLAFLWPPGRTPYLFPLDPARYHALFKDSPVQSNHASLKKLRRRLTADAFGSVLQSLGFLLRYGERLFPGFHFLFGEFVNEEWLALVDYHKPFHRDHIVHQAQVALVVKKLLTSLCFSCVSHPLAAQCRAAEWTRMTPERTYVTMGELAAFVLALGEDGTRYIWDYARGVGVLPEYLKPNTSVCYRFWRDVVYNAAITAALYHDIGYPMQFLHTVVRKVNQSKFTDIIQSGGVHTVYELFDASMCLMPFRGYRSGRGIGLSRANRSDVDDAIGQALRESHGLPGALTFLYLNHQVMDTRDEHRNAAGWLTMELAALAIVMHDMQPVYLGGKPDRPSGGQPLSPRRPHMRIAFRKDPVSFILTLADQIQNYGRFSADFTSADIQGTKLPAVRLDQRIAACRLRHKCDGGDMSITFLFDENHFTDCFLQHQKFNPSVQADYFDPDLGYLDYTGLFERITLGVDFVEGDDHA